MFRVVIQFCILLFILLISPNAFATCNLQVAGLATTQTVQIDADTIGSTSVTVTVNFTVQNTGSSACYYFLTMDEGGVGVHEYNRYANITHALPDLYGQANSNWISYQVYSQSVASNNIVKTLDDAQAAQNVLGSQQILAGQTLNESFTIHVPNQNLPDIIAEGYADGVIMKLYQNANSIIDFANDCPTCTEVSSRPIQFEFQVTDFATLAIGDHYDISNRQAMLDFGVLQSNQSDSFTVYVGGRATSGTCTVTISSENGSKLIRQKISGAPQSHDEIPYTVSAAGTIGGPNVAASIDLSTANAAVNLATSSVPFVCGSNNQGVMGMDVTITLGTVDTSTLYGGIFQDVITIEAIVGL